MLWPNCWSRCGPLPYCDTKIRSNSMDSCLEDDKHPMIMQFYSPWRSKTKVSNMALLIQNSKGKQWHTVFPTPEGPATRRTLLWPSCNQQRKNLNSDHVKSEHCRKHLSCQKHCKNKCTWKDQTLKITDAKCQTRRGHQYYYDTTISWIKLFHFSTITNYHFHLHI